MRALNLLTLIFCMASLSAIAQKKMYLEYDNDCLTRMEYQKISGNVGEKLIHFYGSPVNNTRLILQTDNATERTSIARPAGISKCSSVRLDQSLARQLNTGSVDLYIVSRTKDGRYKTVMVDRVSSISNSGKQMTLKNNGHAFSYDASKFVGADNLSDLPHNSAVYFQGENGYRCVNNYTFKRTTLNTCGSYTNYSIVPELGVMRVEEREYGGAYSAVLPSYELYTINHLPVDSYADGVCSGRRMDDPTIITIPDAVVSTAAPAPAPKVEFYQPPATISDYPMEYGEPTVYEERPSVPSDFDICGKQERDGFHIVRQDETLYSIARTTGVSVKQLQRLNNIPDPKRIPVCTEIRLEPEELDLDDVFVEKGGEIPVSYEEKPTEASAVMVNKRPCDVESAEGIHIVKDGESLYGISRKYGFTVEKFMDINGLENDVISPCMVLKTSDCNCPADTKGDLTEKGVTPTEYNVTFTDFEKDLLEKGGDYGEPVYHILRKGETLYGLSKKFEVSVEKLEALNNINDETSLPIGTKIRIK